MCGGGACGVVDGGWIEAAYEIIFAVCGVVVWWAHALGR